MVTVLNLNPSIDWQYSVPAFVPGATNRVECTRQDVGGKGINVAVALQNFGIDVQLMGLNFSDGGDKIERALDARGISHSLEMVSGQVRTNIKLYCLASGTMTELNQAGGVVPAHSVAEISKKLSTGYDDSMLVLSGSLPPGVPSSFYADIVAKRKGLVFLDTARDALRAALFAQKLPFAVAPNKAELEAAVGLKFDDLAQMISFCQHNIIGKGASIACVSMGQGGAVLVDTEGAHVCPAPSVAVRGLHGAGDAMLAGLIYGFLQGAHGMQLLKYGVAAGSATVQLDGTCVCAKCEFEKIFNEITQKG